MRVLIAYLAYWWRWLTHEPIPPTTDQPDRHRLADMLGITLEPRR